MKENRLKAILEHLKSCYFFSIIFFIVTIFYIINIPYPDILNGHGLIINAILLIGFSFYPIYAIFMYINILIGNYKVSEDYIFLKLNYDIEDNQADYEVTFEVLQKKKKISYVYGRKYKSGDKVLVYTIFDYPFVFYKINE